MTPNDPQFLSHALLRLLLAAALGAAVGVERETKRKPAGLRTIILITFGSALFTILSEALAAIHGGDPQRIAAQLIPGIGFLGAGAILHARGAVVGLTTAATIFVMASVGMAAGGGMFLLATAASLLLLVVLVPVGWLERRYEAKPQVISYTLVTQQADRCIADLQELGRRQGITARDFRLRHAGGSYAVEFTVEAPEGRESEIVKRLQEIQQAHD